MPSPKYQVYNLLETYHELGDYQFKIVLNPRFYRTGHEFRIEMFDSSNRPMNYKFEVWGRKINVAFSVNDNVSDGVAYANIMRGEKYVGRLTFWVIKP